MKYSKQQYCIVIEGRMQENTIKYSKKLCIDDFIKNNMFFKNWKDAYRLGVRCVKVNITIERV
jgi:hypothetical protein